jgi:hypothetical protein
MLNLLDLASPTAETTYKRTTVMRKAVREPTYGMRMKVVRRPPVIDPTVDSEKIEPDVLPTSFSFTRSLMRYGGIHARRTIGTKNMIATAIVECMIADLEARLLSRSG